MPLKLILKMLMVVLIVTTALLYYLPMMNGKPPFYGVTQMLSSVGDRISNASHKVSSTVSGAIPDMPGSSDTQAGKPVAIYRWQDAQGQWHFSSTPPGGGQHYEVQLIDPATNLVQGVPVSKAKPVSEIKSKGTEPRPGEPGSNPYAAESIKNLMDKSHAIKEQMNARNAQLEQIMKQGQ